MSKPLEEYDRIEKKYQSIVVDSVNNGPGERVFYLADDRIVTERLAKVRWMTTITTTNDAQEAQDESH